MARSKSKKLHHIIFLPGLGDRTDHGEVRALKRWQRPGVVIDYHQVGWADNAPLELKMAAITAKIDSLKASGHSVSLVGVSAGASLALVIFKTKSQNLNGAALISGKLHSPWTVNNSYYRKNPALKATFELAHQAYFDLTKDEKDRILTLHGAYDFTVPPAASVIPGVRDKQVIAIGHIPSIAITLLFYGRYIVSYLEAKRLHHETAA